MSKPRIQDIGVDFYTGVEFKHNVNVARKDAEEAIELAIKRALLDLPFISEVADFEFTWFQEDKQ